MVEHAPQIKRDEQYPLLKVDSGGGDGTTRPQLATPAPGVSPGWSVVCTPKKSCLNRWPELLSGCWITLSLLSISLLLFYALGLGLHRRQGVVFFQCNTSKPANEVFYHHIFQRGNDVPFMIYSEYLSSMALQYPSLHFNVFFLMDDSLQSALHGSKRSRLFNKLIPYQSITETNLKIEENVRNELEEFQKTYKNVNITVMLLSKYMATTPLKFKWRTIPLSYLSFYARIFAVWQNGGIGLDLLTFNNLYRSRQRLDRRIVTILKQHNEDGVKSENNVDTATVVNHEDNNETFALLYGLVNQILKETRTLLNKTLSFSQFTTEKANTSEPLLIHSHRNKRDILLQNNVFENNEQNGTNTSLENKHEILILNDSKLNGIASTEQTNIALDIKRLNVHTIPSIQVNETKKAIDNFKDYNKSETQPEIPQVVLFYDFSVFSDAIGPPYILPDMLMEPRFNPMQTDYELKNSIKRPTLRGRPHLLTIDPNGFFVATAIQQHPLLRNIMISGCQRMSPKFVIEDAFLTQCGGNDDVYCNNIYVL